MDDSCDFKTASAIGIYQHVRKKKGLDIQQCELCGATLDYYYMKKHMQRVHGVKQDGEEIVL